eukprot:29067-Pelagococcus_subviridis.AAC.2
MSSRSFFSASCSFMKSSSPRTLLVVTGGLSLNEPTYTLHTSGRAVHAHELLRADLVRLVEDDSHFIVVPTQRRDDGFKLVRDVELVRVEQQQDDVRPRREPLADVHERVPAVDPLLFPGQHPGGVHDGHLLQDFRVALRRLKLGQKARAERGESRVRLVALHRERLPGRRPVLVPVHDDDEPIRRRLRSDVRPGVIPPQQVLDERRLPRAVLPEEQHVGLPFEVAVGEERGVERPKLERLLDGAHLGLVQLLERVHDRRRGLRAHAVLLPVVPVRRVSLRRALLVHRFGPFHASERRGGVQRRQLELKGVIGAGIESEGPWAERDDGESP